MNLLVLITLLALHTTYSQHLLSCPDNECWCCKFSAGMCYNDEGMTPCCCETQESYPCYDETEPYQCCDTGTTCCPEGGCCPEGTFCCEDDLCCYEQPYLFHGICVVSKLWIKPKNYGHSKWNLTSPSCGKPNCFCCCGELICPVQQSGSTESCIERSKDVDMYCNEIGPCQQQQQQQQRHFSPTVPETKDTFTSTEDIKTSLDVIDMTSITQIRSQFYKNRGAGGKNFQFAVFKFGPSNSDWNPSIDDPGIVWSDALVVQEAHNTWQASSYGSCEDGCHTETAIITDTGVTGLNNMFSNECDQGPENTLILNIYSFFSPCITGPGIGCQSLIQTTLTSFFDDKLYKPCNEHEWEINIAWTMQFRDENSEDCKISWGNWAGDLTGEHSNVKVSFGRQSVGEITTFYKETEKLTTPSSFSFGYLKVAIVCTPIILLVIKLLK